MGSATSPLRHCERSEAIQNLSAATIWIASRSLSSGRASRVPVIEAQRLQYGLHVPVVRLRRARDIQGFLDSVSANGE
jgi:hypothetical protein